MKKRYFKAVFDAVKLVLIQLIYAITLVSKLFITFVSQ